MSKHRLIIFKERYGVWRLPSAHPIPLELFKCEFVSVTRTADELSIVSPEALAPADVPLESGWRCIGIQGILDFAMVGVLAEISTLLASSGISIFVISTYNTDYILIKEEKIREAAGLLSSAGHEVNWA